MLLGKQIVLGVTGSISAFKAAGVCSLLCQKGARVRVVMTKAATKFISPLTFQTLSQQSVTIDTFEEESGGGGIAHIELANFAEILLIAPATANIIAMLAHGLATDMLSNVFLATQAKVVIAPAMNSNMLLNPAVQANMDILIRRGVEFIQPAVGTLACGVTGQGRLPEPEDIIQHLELMCLGAMVEDSLVLKGGVPTSLPLANQSIMISAGATIERIDPVRYISNDSSGKMGFAIAQVASEMGADVTVVVGKVQVPPPENVKLQFVNSAQEMHDEMLKRFDDMDIIIMAAAVADYRPAVQAQQKLKKTQAELVLKLERNPDILEELGRRKFHQFLVGFAAETENLGGNAMDKLKRKRLNLIVANDVGKSDPVFGANENEVFIYDNTGLVERIGRTSKIEVARQLLLLVASKVQQKQTANVSWKVPVSV